MSLEDLHEFKALIWQMKQTVDTVSSRLYTPLHMLQSIQPISEAELYTHMLKEIQDMETKLTKLITVSKGMRDKLA